MQTPNDPNQSQYAGTSNPPGPDGQVQISNPDATSGATPSLTAPQPTPPANAQTQTPQGQSPQGQPAQQQAGQIQSDAQGQNGNQQAPKSPNLSKAPAGSQTPVGSMPQQAPPQVQRANLLNATAEALAGGPRYNYNYSADGTLQKTQIPVSTAHLGMAIALEALQGAATGFAHGQGPAGKANAIGASFAGGQQQANEQNNQNKQQAQQDFAQRAQTAETNMRQYMNARTVGKLDDEANDNYINQSKDVADMVQKQFPGYIEDITDYKGLSKYNMTKEMAIPYKRVPRLDSDGKQVEINGVPQSDINYMVLRPEFRSSGFLTPDITDTLTKHGVQGLGKTISDPTLAARLGLNMVSQAGMLHLADNTTDNIFKTIDEADAKSKGTTTGPVDMKTGELTIPSIKNPEVAVAVDKATDALASSLKDLISPANFKALAAATTNQEDAPGDPNAKSVTGATGPFQLTDATAKGLGVTNRNDITQNVNGGTQLLATLLKQYQGDPTKTIAAYYSGPRAIDKNGNIVASGTPGTPGYHSAEDTQKYVDQVSERMNLHQTTASPVTSTNPSLADYMKANPGMMDPVQKFMGALASLPQEKEGRIGDALAAMRASGQEDAATKMAGFFSQKGPDAIQKHDDYVDSQDRARKAETSTEAMAQRIAMKGQADAAAQLSKQKMLDTFHNATIPANALSMDPDQVVKTLQDQGVTLPGDVLRGALAVAKYEQPSTEESNKKWYKDTGVDQQQLNSLAQKFNPKYRASTYQAANDYAKPGSKPNITIQAAAGAANHLQMLKQASQLLADGNESTAYPMLNSLANTLGYHAGGTGYIQISGLLQAINGEMGKSLSGGFAPNKEEIENLNKVSNPAEGNRQLQAMANQSIGVLHGKVKPIDETFSQMTNGEHMYTIPNSLTQAFQAAGLDTPWDEGNQKKDSNGQTVNQSPKQPNPQPNEKAVYVGGNFAGYTTDGKTITRLP
jgi:Transglycosylase SLT domain